MPATSYRFTQFIQRCGFSYPSLSDATGLKVRTLQRWGQEESLPSIGDVAVIATAMKQPLRAVAEAFGVDCSAIPLDPIPSDVIEQLVAESLDKAKSSVSEQMNRRLGEQRRRYQSTDRPSLRVASSGSTYKVKSPPSGLGENN